MRQALWMIPALAMALAACGTQPTATAPSGTAGASIAAPSGTEAAAGPTITVNPTSVAIAQTFEVPVRGNKDSRVRIYEFSDYLCPYCGRFALETEREVLKKYGPDEVAIVFWDFPLSGHGVMSTVSAEATHCAEEQAAGDFWKMHDVFYEKQAELLAVPADGEAAAVDLAVKLAEGKGVDGAALRTCLESKKYQPIVGALYQQALERGVQMTPTLVLVSRNPQTGVYGDPETGLGALEMADLDAYIQRGLSRSLGTAVPTPTEPPTETPAPTTAANSTLPAGAVATATP